ncbi:MAG: pantoate--beta-alanine ligase [Flavobacteriales bacterium]
MRTFEEQGSFRAYLDRLAPSERVGYVPTMGTLHEGHLALVRKAKSECDHVVVSIFVNPTQFNDPKDLEQYPRDPEGDARALEQEGVDLLFMPYKEEIYPEKDPRPPKVDLSGIMDRMEGPYRPGHFEGVLMVLDRLFAMVRPHRAYFGEKDHQQLLVVRALAQQRSWGIDVIGVATVRESNGLATSSRNQRLSSEGWERAAIIFQTLCWMRSRIAHDNIPFLKEASVQRLENAGMKVDYVEVADTDTLRPVESFDPESPVKGFVAASLEGVRLIDNLGLNP